MSNKIVLISVVYSIDVLTFVYEYIYIYIYIVNDVKVFPCQEPQKLH